MVAEEVRDEDGDFIERVQVGVCGRPFHIIKRSDLRLSERRVVVK